MKGLIIKDFLNMKRYLRNVLIILVVYFGIFIPSHNFNVLIGVVMIMCSMLVITSISYDDAAKWDKFALTMPLTKRDIVLAKYMLALVFIFGGALITIIVLFATGLVIDTIPLMEILSLVAVMFALGLIFESLILPLIFKYGVERARLLMILCLLVPSGLVVLGATAFGDKISPQAEQFLPLAAIVFAVIIFYISYRISRRIYDYKDF